MISSRSKQSIPYGGRENSTLADVRLTIAEQLQAETLLDEALFDVWINEPAGAAAGSDNLWEECLAQVRRADLVVVFYNGDAGWADASGKIGICHAEMQEVLNTAPAKLRVLQLSPMAPKRKGADGRRDELFRQFAERQRLFTGQPCSTGEELIALTRRTVREAVSDMVRLGVREARKGRFYTGEALDWNRLDMRTRQHTIQSTIERALLDRGARPTRSGRALVAEISGVEVVVVCSAIAASFSVAEGREGANQLFLRDYEHEESLGEGQVGPVHIIGCHRSVTESQAIRQLGFPDATVVTTPFGVYVADEIHKVQLIFLANCRDPTTSMFQMQRLFDWLDQAGEGPLLATRAAARTRIVRAIARERSGSAKKSVGG
jgi:hypothetical protein